MILKILSGRRYRVVVADVSVCLFISCAVPSGTLADDLPKESILPLGMANKAIQAALDACKKMAIG